MARVRYYYDTETCEFKPHRFGIKDLVRGFLVYSAIGLVFAGIFFFLLFNFFTDLQLRQLENEKKELEDSYSEMSERVDQLASALDLLHDKDNQVYRTMMGAQQVSDDKWAGGVGGKSSQSELPAPVENLDDRLNQLLAQVEVQRRSYDELLQAFEKKEDELVHTPSIRPVTGAVISGFGNRNHPILKQRRMHTGLDFQAPIGTPVYATADGTVSHAGYGQNGYGIHIDIRHGFGWETKYAHLSRVAVAEGAKVKRGQLIGYTGNTGLSKGPHLHYEIAKKGDKIDPIDYFYSDLDPTEYVEFKRAAGVVNESMD